MPSPVRSSIRCILAAAIALCAPACTTDQPHASTARTSRPDPQPSGLLDLDGAARDLWPAESSSTPITVIIFTRTDCPISNRFAPEIRALHDRFHTQGVDFYLIYVDPTEQPAAIREHVREYSYPCQALRDPKHMLVAHCHATVTPQAVVFDRNRAVVYTGRISDLYVTVGNPRSAATTHDLADAIDATVHNRPVASPRTGAVGCIIADLKD